MTATAIDWRAMHFAEQHQCCGIVDSKNQCGLWCGHDGDHLPYTPGDYLQAPLLHPLDVARLLLSGAEQCPLCGESVRWRPWANVMTGWECDGPICVWLPKGPLAWIAGPEWRREYEWRFHPCGCVGRTDTGRMLSWLRETLDAAEQTARIIDPGGYEPQTWHVMPSRSRRWVWVYSKSRLLGEPPEAAVREDDQPVAIVRTGRNEHMHIAGQSPAALLRRIAKDRETLAECEKVLAVDGWEYDDAPELAATVIRNLAEGWGWTEETP